MNIRHQHTYDAIVIGGGIAGASLAYGLQRLGCRAALLDASPGQFGPDKASRGNMGLIWCQSKFAHFPEYARWGFMASERYAEFARAVQELSGLDVRYRPSGGLIPCLGKEDYGRRAAYLETLRETLGPEYPARMLSLEELREKLPRVAFGPEVCGAVWCERDGFIEPLRLMYALRKAHAALGGRFFPEAPALAVRRDGAGWAVDSTRGRAFRADRVVLAAGLSNKKLCSALHCHVPLFADRSQVLLTERIEDVLPIPILGITRTPGGTVMIGFMHERAGSDTRLEPRTVIKEGQWALRVWPDLGKLRIIRSWSGLRVMPDDGQPIYDRLPGHPGVFVINAHSGVTLAPVHADLLAPWIAGRQDLPAQAATFTLGRFKASEAAC